MQARANPPQIRGNVPRLRCSWHLAITQRKPDPIGRIFLLAQAVPLRNKRTRGGWVGSPLFAAGHIVVRRHAHDNKKRNGFILVPAVRVPPIAPPSAARAGTRTDAETTNTHVTCGPNPTLVARHPSHQVREQPASIVHATDCTSGTRRYLPPLYRSSKTDGGICRTLRCGTGCYVYLGVACKKPPPSSINTLFPGLRSMGGGYKTKPFLRFFQNTEGPWLGFFKIRAPQPWLKWHFHQIEAVF